MQPAFADGPYLWHDVVRLLIVIPSLLLTMVTLRVSYLRFRSPPGDVQRNRSAFGLASYACFTALAGVLGLTRFGMPLDPILATLAGLGLLFGLLATFATVRFRLFTGWNTAGQQRRADQAEGQAARERREDDTP
jgi:hypothetical protein